MGLLDRAIAESVPVIPRPIVRRISRRYIAGDTLDEAVETVRDLNRRGCVATIDLLGESTESKADAASKLGDYKKVIDALDEHDLESGISVKLTGLGLTLSEELCRANLEEIVEYAAERDRFVRVDMEDSPYTEATIQTVLDFHERHENIGAVIQAYMRRSLQDVVRLVEAGVSVRLCKGIYDEPRRIAYKNFYTVRHSYVLLLEELFRGGVYVGIATHDEHLVLHALRLIHQLEIPKDRYEFQMLLGVDEELRGILVGAGHKLRVYVPFGEDWYEYSSRRLKENPKIAGYVAKDVLGSVASTTDASTAGTLIPNSPWKTHSESGSTRRSGLSVRISGSRNPFHTCSPW
jgi:proline dehydrogenase